jgi:hypothetical protein
MNVYGGVDMWLHSFQISATDIRKWLASRTGRLTDRVEGYVGSTNSLRTLERAKIATVVDLLPKFWFDSRSVSMGFMVGKVAPVQFFFWKIFNIFLSVSSH